MEIIAYKHFKLPSVIVLTATMLCGIPFGAFGAQVTGIVLMRTPAELRSKTLALYTACAYLLESVSVLGIAFLISCCGLQVTLKSFSILFAALVIISFCLWKKEELFQESLAENKKAFTK